ncbi:unnamed protein product [Rotaria sp. Silwood2]|nr:unnamed protein product [Rotaria sp. Silwood2]CAF2772004.1 unnamed protein product [Rotaria sp. Silwood2]CAF3178205.1 unnamed protein product [Rotaria sp. Silwood2]
MVGYPSAFVAQRLDQQCPSVSLLRDEDPTLESFRDRPIEPLCVVPVTTTWLQSLPLSRTRSLTTDGCICLSNDPELLNHHPK